MNMSMNTQRITVSVAEDIYLRMISRVPIRGVSKFVADAVAEKLMEETGDPFDAFLALRKRTHKINQRKIFDAIKKGRM